MMLFGIELKMESKAFVTFHQACKPESAGWGSCRPVAETSLPEGEVRQFFMEVRTFRTPSSHLT
jgi:hypothetical protein